MPRVLSVYVDMLNSAVVCTSSVTVQIWLMDWLTAKVFCGRVPPVKTVSHITYTVLVGT